MYLLTDLLFVLFQSTSFFCHFLSISSASFGHSWGQLCRRQILMVFLHLRMSWTLFHFWRAFALKVLFRAWQILSYFLLASAGSFYLFIFIQGKLSYLELASWTQFRWSQFCRQYPKHRSQEPAEQLPPSLHQPDQGIDLSHGSLRASSQRV